MKTTDDSRLALMDATRGLVLTRGYGAVGIAGICERAGVKRGSLYHFFPGKEDLVITTLEALYAEFEAEVLRPALSSPGGLQERLTAFIRAIHGFQDRMRNEEGRLPGCPFGSLALEAGADSPRLREAMQGHLDAIRTAFRTTLDQAVTAGELPRDTDTRRLADHWLALMEGILLMARTEQDPDTILRLAPALEALVQSPVPATFGETP